ncbi:MAG: DUF2179 domain-containing protein [Candidatus Adiutrix sp.]
MTEFLDAYPWALPLVIFFGRIIDVSLGTLRIVFVSRGARNIAPIIGFVEVFIWIIVIAQVFSRADSLLAYLSYAAGYSFGTYLGLTLENRIGLGFAILRLFTSNRGVDLVRTLNEHGFGATIINAEGAVTKVNIVETVIRRVSIREVEKLIHTYDPSAFYTIEDVRTRRKGIFAKYF